MKIIFEAITTKGLHKRENQDSIYVNGNTTSCEDRELKLSGISDEVYQIFAVCDGMGGADDGATASSMVINCLEQCIRSEKKLNYEEFIKKANKQICEYQSLNEKNMGTTFAGIFIEDSNIQIANIGDSRIYRIQDGKISQLSKDDNEYQMLLEADIQVSEQVARNARCHLTQYIGLSEQEFELEPHILEIKDSRPGDSYLICSDGVCSALTYFVIEKIIAEYQQKNTVCEQLIKSASQSHDNITSIFVYIESV